MASILGARAERQLGDHLRRRRSGRPALAQIGVKMKIEQLEETTAQELYNTERFTLRISAWTNDTPDPDELMGVALDYEPQNGLHSSYRSDEARDLVLEARRILDQESARSCIQSCSAS